MARHVATVAREDTYKRRQYRVAAKQWTRDDDDARDLIQWLEIFAAEAKFFAANGFDYSSRDSVSVRTPDHLSAMFGYPGQWFVFYPDGSLKIMSDVEFEDEFVKHERGNVQHD